MQLLNHILNSETVSVSKAEFQQLFFVFPSSCPARKNSLDFAISGHYAL